MAARIIMDNEFNAEKFMRGEIPQVLYEDNHIIVAVKPQNMPSQKDSSGDEDFLSAIKAYIKEKYSKRGNVFIGLVHRLDRPAGGVMVFARTSKAAARLSDSVKNGGFEKRYLAVVKNSSDLLNEAVLKNYLIKDRNKNTSYVAGREDEGAKYAELKYKILCRNNNAALAEIELKTGRAHQIRVQLLHIGAPLYGDYKYGGAKEGNLALWAYSLKFAHPVKKEKMSFLCPPPESFPWLDFKSIIDEITTSPISNR